MELGSLISILVEEHAVMKAGLQKARVAAKTKDYGSLTKILKELDPVFRQHVLDEEAQILRMLIESLGVEGAREEIRIFQQHRPIYKLMLEVAGLASKSASELEEEAPRLELLFAEHALAEEERVFPRATSLSEGPADRP